VTAQQDPERARELAHEILQDGRYQGVGLPRPLQGPVDWIESRLEELIGWVDTLGADAPGGTPVVWSLFAFGVLLVAFALAATTIRRRAVVIERARRAALPAADDPRALERDAERAERAGEWERAVRLRFRAGLLRLDRRRVLAYRPSLTTGEVARAVGSPAFAEIGARFDAIAYGGRTAQRDDAEAARRGWEQVLAEHKGV
jgi:hypothetical protein